MDHNVAPLESGSHQRVDVVRAIRCIKQSLCTRRNETFAVHHNVAKLAAQIGAPGFPGQHHGPTLGLKPGHETVDLGGLSRPISTLKREEKASHV